MKPVDEGQQAAESRGRRAWMALILGSLAAFAPLSIDMYLPALPALAVDLPSSTSVAQLSLTFCLLGLSLGQLLYGPMSDVYGRRRPLLAGLAVYALASFLCAFSPNMETLIALRFVQGFAGSAGIVISRAVVRDLYSGAALTRFFALLMLVNGVAPIAAPVAGAQLLRFTAWPGVFVTLGGLGLLMLLAVSFGLPETLPADRRSRGGLAGTLATFRRLLTHRRFMGYALAQGLVITAMFAYISGSPFVLQNLYGASPQLFSLLFAINGLGIIIAGQVTGRLAGKVDTTRLLAGGLWLAAFGGAALLAAIVLGGGLGWLLPTLFVIVSSVGIVSGTSFALAMQDQAQAAGSASALLGVLSFIAGGMVAPLVGLGGGANAVPMGSVIAAAETAALISFGALIGWGALVGRKEETK